MPRKQPPPPDDDGRKVFDISMKALLQADPLTIAQLGLPGVPLRLGAPPRVAAEPVAITRPSDGLISLVGPAGPFLLHVEFETVARADFDERMLLYSVLLRNSLPGPPTIRSMALLLKRPRRGPKGEVRIAYDGHEVMTFRYDLVRVYEMPAAELARQAALAPFTPLGRGARPEHIAEAAQAVRAADGEPALVRERLAVLDLLGSRMMGPAVRAIIQWSEVQMSWAYEQAVEKGIEQGRQEGRQEGLNHERQVFSKMVRLRYPRSRRGLDDLLPRCDADDLAWLGEALMTTDRFTDLRTQLERRLRDRAE